MIPVEFGLLQLSTDDERWEALVTRNPCADGRFLCGSKTTRIFCRPTCPSRKPQRKNVRFFATIEVAIKAGYRACRRCTPAEPSPHQRHAAAIEQACTLIEEAEDPPSLDHLAAHVGLSRFYFHRLFKRYLGITPKEYAITCQLERFKTSLGQGTPIIQAIYDAGFSSTSRIYERTARELGMTPARFKSGAGGISIRYVVTQSPLGQLLVAMTEEGVCAIEIDTSPHELAKRLSRRFPRATVVEAGLELKDRIDYILRIIIDSSFDFDLPIDIQSTAFQRRVWKAIQRTLRNIAAPMPDSGTNTLSS